MKTLSLSLLFIATNIFANVYCYENSKLVHVLSGEWDRCNGELYTGKVCYRGNRAEAIELLNSQAVKDKFEGTDGEYVGSARAYRQDQIRYRSVDSSNRIEDTHYIRKCQ